MSAIEQWTRWCELCVSWSKDLCELDDGRTLLLLRMTTQSPSDCKIDNWLPPLLARLQWLLWENLHSVLWKESHAVHRCIFGTSIAVQVSLELEITSQPEMHEVGRWMRAIDLGLMMGTEESHDILNSVLGRVLPLKPRILPSASKSLQLSRKNRREWAVSHLLSESGELVSIEDALELSTFLENYFSVRRPVVIRKSIDDWPAMDCHSGRRWNDLSYILSVCGDRTVPVETGASYLSSDSSCSLMTVREFVETFIVSQSADTEKGYIAQHNMLAQFPQLRRDISVPDYCCLLDEDLNECEEHLTVVENAWFGPCDTFSPLHFDCYNNILAQVAGYKYIRIIDPQYTEKLYALLGSMRNSSAVDYSDPQWQRKYPDAANLPFFECVLGPGECLFLPRGFWHLVQAIPSSIAREWRAARRVLTRRDDEDILDEFSFSVSFWWGMRTFLAPALS